MPVGSVKCTLAACGAGQAEGSRISAELILERRVGAALAKHSGKAEGARTVRGLLEVSHVDCNCTGCIFSVRYCKGKKKVTFFVSLAPKQLSLVLAQRPAGERC